MNYLKEVKKRGIKTTWLAKQFGISQPAMYMKLTGERTMNPEEEERLLHILDMSKPQGTWQGKLPKPNSVTAEGALLLLQYRYVSRKFAMENAWILNFPDIILRLRRMGVEIVTHEVKKENRYGRSISYGLYEAPDKDHLREVYLKIVGDEK